METAAYNSVFAATGLAALRSDGLCHGGRRSARRANRAWRPGRPPREHDQCYPQAYYDMNKFPAIFFLSLLLASCRDPFAHEWENLYQLSADQIILPDTAQIFQPMQVKVQVTLDTSNHNYKDQYIETTPDGYLIVLIGVIEDTRFPDNDPDPRTEWHSFNLIPFKKGEVIIEGKRVNSENLIDSVYVQ